MSLARDTAEYLDKHVSQWRSSIHIGNFLASDIKDAIRSVAIETDVVFFDLHDIYQELKELSKTEV